jgi:hypothetical protein
MKPLYGPFNVVVHTIVNKLFPTGYDVSADAPGDWATLYSHVRSTGRMEVSNVNSDQSIFADAETNYAFRAWHDHCHLRDHDGVFLGSKYPFNYPGTFDWEGEVWVYKQMLDDVIKIYSHCGEMVDRLLEAEVLGQFLHQKAWGCFPVNQFAFTRAYLVNPVLALAGRRF